MLICACDQCHYLFEAPELPEQCPDCGKRKTRPASQDEQTEYRGRAKNNNAEEWNRSIPLFSALRHRLVGFLL